MCSWQTGLRTTLQTICVTLVTAGLACADDSDIHVASPSEADLHSISQPLFEASCYECHDRGADIDLTLLPASLDSAEAMDRWAQVYDRVRSGEMPPNDSPRPDPKTATNTLESLHARLHAASLRKQQEVGRVVARRLTKLEMKYTLEDLFALPSDGTSHSNWDLVVNIPDEADSEHFDTVGAAQRISSMHIAAYLEAAAKTLDRAIVLEPLEDTGPYRNNFQVLSDYHDLPLERGGNLSRATMFGRGIIVFADAEHLTMFADKVLRPGIYRLSAKVTSVQSQKPVTAKIVSQTQQGAYRILKAVDLAPAETQFLSVDAFMLPGASAHVTMDLGAAEPYSAILAAGGARSYRGPGLSITYQALEGPVFAQWPPASTQFLLGNDLDGEIDVSATIKRLAPLVLRRDVSDAEVQRFVSMATDEAESEVTSSLERLRRVLRAMLTSPQFLLFQEKPGPLDNFAIANRLSYFLWASMPDAELFGLAREGSLTDPAVLTTQVRRMLDDPKAGRFIEDFAGQWLRLYKVDATQPDLGLFPEFDDLLADSIPRETYAFLDAVFRENLSLNNLVDSEFTFLNRRLAEHYGIQGVRGLEMRRVELPAGSVRGGILTQAAILKTTANGTTTSPVVRGNFVLSNLLGSPPESPPAGVTSIEPDTRGAETIRELLDAHRSDATCNSCHREIDPPGFALESFDPTGGFRTRYRREGERVDFGEFSIPGAPILGSPVDPSGVTSGGRRFAGINEFKAILADQQTRIVENFVRQLATYATGGKIEFADREIVMDIVQQAQSKGFGARDILEAIVTSRLFLHK